MAPAKALRLVGALSRGLEESVIRFDDQSALPFEDLGAEGCTGSPEASGDPPCFLRIGQARVAEVERERHGA